MARPEPVAGVSADSASAREPDGVLEGPGRMLGAV